MGLQKRVEGMRQSTFIILMTVVMTACITVMAGFGVLLVALGIQRHALGLVAGGVFLWGLTALAAWPINRLRKIINSLRAGGL